MKKCKPVKLKDIAVKKLEYGSGASAIEYDGNTRYIRITDINEFGDLSKKKVSPSQFNEKYTLNKGDILFARSGATVGKTYIHTEDDGISIYAGYLIRFIPNKELVNPKYVYYYTKSPRYQNFIQLSQRAVAQPNINAKQYSEMDLPLYSMDIQNQITKILDKTQEIINCQKRQLEELDHLIRATFYEMFGDPVRNDKNLKTIKLIDLIQNRGDLVDGPFGSSVNTNTDYIENGEIPVIRTKNVSNNLEFVTDDLKFMTREKYNTVIRSQVLPNDIILTKVGTIGNVCIFPSLYKEAVLSTTGSCRIRPNKSMIEPKFLMYYLYFYKPKMLKIASTGVQAFLNMNHIKNFDIFHVEKAKQEKFIEIIEKIEEQKSIVKQSIDNSQNLLDSLMGKYFDY